MTGARRIACLMSEGAKGRAAESACTTLWDVASAFSPRVEICEEDDCVFVDITGLGRLFEDEAQIVRAMRHAAEKVGSEVRIGVGSGKVIARIFAVGAEKRNHRDAEPRRSEEKVGLRNIPSLPTSQTQCLCGFSSSSEREGLAVLPIQLLRPSDGVVKVLWQWGLRTIGDLAELPRKEIEARLGREGIALHRLACAEDDAPIVPTPVPETFREAVDFDYGVCNLEPLAFVMRGLLDRLAERLACRGLAASLARVTLTLVSRRQHQRAVSLAAPTRDAKTLLDLIRLDLAEHPPDAEIEAVAIDLIARTPRAAQLGLFEPKGPSPDRLATTLARLSAIVGRERLGAPALVDSHRPEVFALVAFGEEKEEIHHGDTESRRAFSGEHFSVSPCLRGESFSSSSVLRRERTSRTVAIEALSTRVAELRGPFRLVGEWWAATSFARDYYDATLRDGSHIRLYRDITSNSWVIDGLIH